MIITLSGAQGQGKTTILKRMEKEGYQVIYNTTARDILELWGTDLNTIYSDSSMAMDFQDEILRKQELINKSYLNTITPVLMERSFADIFTYALFAVGCLNSCGEWLNNYHDKCVELQKSYSKVIFLTGRNYTPSDDGVRSTNKLYGDSVDLIIRQQVEMMAYNSKVENRFISGVDFELRTRLVHDIIKESESE